MDKVVGDWNQRKYLENDHNCDGMCETCCDAGREFSICVGIFYKEWLRDVRFWYLSATIIAVEAAKQGVVAGGDAVSGLMLAHDLVGLSETFEGLQTQLAKAL